MNIKMDDILGKNKVRISVITSLFNCKKYLEGYFSAVEQIINKEDCEFLLLHNAPTEDELEIIEKYIKNKSYFRHIIIEKREGLYTTWNRGVDLAQGEYCAIWNVDDIREPKSLLLQMEALVNNSKASVSFGDIWCTNIYGKYKKKLYVHPTWDENQKAYMYRHLIGCFPFWRRSIHNKIKYFDEQFKLVGDLDFQIRVARSSIIQKVKEIDGYYLTDSTHKLSSNRKLQIIESNMLNFRYGNFNLLNLVFIYPALKHYNIFSIKNGGVEYKIKSLFPDFYKYWLIRLPLIIFSFLRMPEDLARFIYHKFIK